MKKKKKKIEAKYEITMYKLLAIFGIGLLVFMGIGYYMGNIIGRAQALDSVDVDVPEYCNANYKRGKIVISCTELEDYTALELCNILSTPIKDKIKVVVISSETDGSEATTPIN